MNNPPGSTMGWLIKMTTVISIALAVVFVVFVAAQQPANSGQEKRRGGQMMSMGEMTQECRTRCQETAKSVDRTTKIIDEMDRMETMHGKGQKKQ